MNVTDTIKSMLNEPWGQELQGQSRRHICWKFCHEIYCILGIDLPHQHHLHRRLDVPKSPCVVLFHAVADWHFGVVWPDGLHFIHAISRDIFDPNPTEYVVRMDRLTAWPYNLLIEGYYGP